MNSSTVGRKLIAFSGAGTVKVMLYSAGKIRGFLHLCVGEEAIAAGVMPELTAEDAVVSTYREHGHALAGALEELLDGEEASLEVEGVEGGLGEEEVDAPAQEGGGLFGNDWRDGCGFKVVGHGSFSRGAGNPPIEIVYMEEA